MAHSERDYFPRFLAFTPATLFFIALVLSLSFSLIKPSKTFSTSEKAGFDGISFKTRYQTVKITTPILIEMENKTRLLKISLQNPESAKFKFLHKLTPLDIKLFKEGINEINLSPEDYYKSVKSNVMLLSQKNAYFFRGNEKVFIGEITVNIDGNSTKWIDDNKNVIERNFNDCKTILLPKNQSDMFCPPLLIEARITKIERSVLSPFLPLGYFFPRLDYVDIYIGILSIEKNKSPKLPKKTSEA